jgi:hypothetical protein
MDLQRRDGQKNEPVGVAPQLPQKPKERVWTALLRLYRRPAFGYGVPRQR